MPAVESSMMYFSANLPNNFTASFGSVVMAATSLSASATSACRDDDLWVLVVQCDGANAEALLMRHSEPITLTIFMMMVLVSSSSKCSKV